jgi:microsomal dipeptidase-like Zn-dependent dipeptidase
MNMEKNDDKSDLIKVLAVSSRWPTRTWSSLLERARYQAEKLATLEAGSHGKLTILRSAGDLKSFLQRRKSDPTLVAGFLGIEGAHALEGSLANVDVLYDAGVRMIAPTHFFDNEWGGSAHGVAKTGLTPLGRKLVEKLEQKKILVDLAHASPQTFTDVLAMTKRKVVVSHTGVQGTCRGTRNLSDEQLRAVAKNGGLIGIGFWDIATCGQDAASIAKAIAHAVAVAGVDHVALGSDFDGSVTTPFDAADLVYLTDALLNAGFSEDTIRKVMGENALKLLAESLP